MLSINWQAFIWFMIGLSIGVLGAFVGSVIAIILTLSGG